MENFLCCSISQISCWDIATMILAVFTTFVSIGYFIKPRLHYCVYKRKIVLDSAKESIDEIDESCFNADTHNSPNSIEQIDNFKISSEFSRKEMDPFNEEIWEKDNYNWVVKVENKNWFCFTIREIQCEIALSATSDFIYARTLKLIKDKTLFLKPIKTNPSNNYRFVSKNCFSTSATYKFLRVRLLASNFLGVKKHYESVCKIEIDLKEFKNDCNTQCCY